MNFTKGQEFISEFFGTMVLILFGCGSVAMVVLFGSQPPIPGEIVKGGYTNIVLGWGLAVVFGIYVAVTISGAHINPAVTIALAATGRFPWSKAPHYIIARFTRAFAGALLLLSTIIPKANVVGSHLQDLTPLPPRDGTLLEIPLAPLAPFSLLQHFKRQYQ